MRIEGINMKKRITTVLLTAVMILSLSSTAFAEEINTGTPSEPVLCSVTEGCTLEDRHEGECVPAPAEGENEAAVPGGEETEPEQETPSGELTAEEKLAELIAALPAPGDVDPENMEQAEAVHNQLAEIYAFAEENGIDVEGNEIINAVIVALNPVEVLEDAESSAMSGYCGAEGNESNVTWTLEQNNEDNENPTYTLTISGNGTMANYTKPGVNNASPAPWDSYRQQITSVTVSEGITNIGTRALWNLAITELRLPVTLTSIASDAIRNCTKLTSVSIPDSVTTIGGWAFSGDTSLKSVSFGSGLSSLGTCVFENCTSVETVNISDECNSFKVIDGVLFNKDGTKLVYYPAAKDGNTYKVPSGVYSIGAYAFQNILKLETLVIGNDVTNLETAAIRNATSLKSLTLGENITSFASSLSTMPALETLYYNCKNATVNNDKSGLVCNVSSNSSKLKVVVGEAVEKIPAQFCYNNINVVSVEVNGNIQTWGGLAFNDCANLKSVIFGKKVSNISGNTFSGKTTALKYVKVCADSISLGNDIFGDEAHKSTYNTSITYDFTDVKSITASDASASSLGRPFGNRTGCVYVPSKSTIVEQRVTDNSWIIIDDGTLDATKDGFAAVTKAGFIVTWYDNAECTGEAVTTPTAGKTYYAKWVEAVASVTAQDGSVVNYASLQSAVDAAKSGDTITLIKDIVLSAPVNVAKEITLNLNGKTISSGSNNIWGEDNWSLISVRAGGNLTINGEGKLQTIANDCYAVDVRDGALCTINGGEYIGNIHAVYVHKGSLTVNGGKFSVQQIYSQTQPYQFTLNCLDANRVNGTAKISVTGGEFYKFNPQDCEAEGKGTNFAGNSCVIADGDWYKVNAAHTEVIDAAKAATCTETGLTEGKHCSVCGIILVAQEMVAANGHSYDAVVTAPTCTEKGYTTHTCSACGDSYTDSETDAKGHSFGEWETVTSPGCTDKGSQKRTCTACKVTETRDVDPNGHDWEENFTVDKQPTAAEDGSKSIHCKNCNAVKESAVIPALGQQPAKVEAESIPTGKTLVSGAVKEEAKTALESAVKDAFKNEFVGKNVLMVEISLINTATWEADHTEKVTFTVGYPAGITAENFKNYDFVVLHQKTDGSMELSSFEATANGLKITSTLSPFAIGYSEKHIHSFAAEWKSDNASHWKECACGEKGEAAAHDFKWVTDKAATATANGSKHKECSVCGYKTESVVIPATVVPQTGDNSNLVLWIVLFAVSVSGAAGTFLYSRKRKHN